MVSNRTAVRVVISALVVGAVLIILGVLMIVGARHTAHHGFAVGSADGIFVYYVWDVFQLATGIVLALVGTATGAASLTCLTMNRKRKGA